MDYSSYKTMCDTSLEQIRKSENKRQELDHKLQKMYQEKSECEKSIIKTLQSQQKQFVEENRRRAERNESILRALERIDYQASSLAAKTERLRALKKQYEKYLLSLWNRRRQAIYPANLSTTGQIPSRFASKYDESPVHQSYLLGSEHKLDYPRFANASLPPHANFPAPAALNYPHNQSYFQNLPSTQMENSIKSSNYRTTGAVIESQFSYPSTYQVRYDDLTLTPQYQQSVEKKSFYHNDTPIRSDDTNLPTINSIYRQQQTYHHAPPQFPTFDEKSTVKTFHPIYQQHNQPLENHNYNSGNSKLSETFYGKPFIMPAASSESYVTQLSPKPTVLSATSSEMLLKVHSDKIPPNKSDATSVHMSDGDEESDGEKSNLTKRNIRRGDLLSETTFHHQQQQPFDGQKAKVESSVKNPDDFIENFHLKHEANTKHPQGETDMNRIELRETRPINESVVNANMHQVWEKSVVDPMDIQHASSFVIPKIIVETQIDLTETSPSASVNETMSLNQSRADWKPDDDSPEKLLNHEMKKRSTDNQQNKNESLSYQTPNTSAANNNLPLEETGSSIYHYDKQPFSDEQQNHQKHPQSRVEHELRRFGEMEISKSSRNGDESTAATRAMTHESEIKTDNSLAEGSLDDKGVQGRKETINNINDDKNQGTSSSTPTAVALTDKISEIYRKIGKIEDNYYDEKGKIIESFERKLSSTSLSDGAKIETQPITGSIDAKYDVGDVVEPPLKLEDSIQQEANQISAELQSNLIQESDGSGWKNDQLQSEIATDWGGTETQGNQEPNYNYGENIENENQQNFLQPQSYPETLLSSADEYSQQYQIEGQLQPQFDNQYDAGGAQTYPGDEYPAYEQTQQYQDYTVVDNNDPHQQQSEFVYSHHDNTQHYQQQQQQEANNYNPPQSDSDYQQNNYDETQENPSNYTNDSAAVYYDYDQNQQQQQLETAPNIITYDDQNYSHQQPAQYQSNEGEAPQYFYASAVNDKAEVNSNVNNYGYTTENQSLNETSGDGTLYNASEYQTGSSNNYDDGTNMYELQATNEATLEHANYEPEQFEQRSNENYEQPNEVSYERDESYLTTTASSSSENSKPLETEAQMNVNRDVDESAPIQPSKRDDIKLVKQLLDSESDDTTSRSNLLKTSIKEEADESDFDFSAG